MYTLEIAVFNIGSALLAAASGADRIELCENPADGGTTPSYGTLVQVREKTGIPVFPIIRPRGGDFLYTDEEYAVMRKDLALCKSLGFDGAVVGLLQKDGTVDVSRTAALVELAYPLEITFHRAFDRALQPYEALEDVIKAGCQRILTSGQVPNAPDGKALIWQLVQQAEHRIIIMPGSGVRSNNIADLASFCGVEELHSSARIMSPSAMSYQQPGMAETNEQVSVDTNEIAQMKQQLNKLLIS